MSSPEALLGYSLAAQPNTRARQEVDTEQLDNFLTLGFLELLPLEEPLAFQREGVQQGVIEKLRSGKYPARPA
jgi:DNA-nicking Smr family endonuclease